MVDSIATIGIPELLDLITEGADMVDNIFDGENVIPEPAAITQVPKHMLMRKQEVEESKDSSARKQPSQQKPNLAQIKLQERIAADKLKMEQELRNGDS